MQGLVQASITSNTNTFRKVLLLNLESPFVISHTISSFVSSHTMHYIYWCIFFFLLFLSILQHLTQIWSNDWIFKKNPSWGNKSCTCPFWSFRISLSWHHWYWWHMLCKIVHVYSITVGYHRYLKQVCFDKKQNLFQNIMHTQTHILVILNNIPGLFQKIK